ncbi:MAG: O-antigen ligase family protein [Candidatus Neomarinimicrobiota bacterium]
MIIKFGKLSLITINSIPFVEILLLIYISSVIIFSMIPVGNIVSKLIGLILIYVFVIITFIGNKKIVLSREIKIVAVWLIFCIISAIVATNINLVFLRISTLLQLSVFFIAGYSIIVKGKLSIKSILYSFVLSVFIIYVYGFINQYDPSVLVTKNRITATVGDPNILSVYGAFAFIISLFLLKVENSRIGKLFIIIIMGLILCGVVLTQSRQGILISIIGLTIYILIQVLYKFINANNRIEYALKLLLYLVLFVTSFAIIIYLFKTSEYSYRFQALAAFIKLNFTSSNDLMTRIIDYSAYERKQLIRYAIQVWFDNPVFGVGLDNFKVILKQYNPLGPRLYAHNNYLELLATIGTIGAIIYYSIYASIILRLFHLQKILKTSSIELKMIHLFLTILFSLMVLELFTVTYYTKFTWIFLLIIVGYADRIVFDKVIN